MVEFTDWEEMKFKPAKCATLSCINSKPLKFVESYSPIIKGEPITALKWGDRYRYLGVPLGRTRVSSLDDLKESIIDKARAICSSLLTDWQKVDAINTFVVTDSLYTTSEQLYHRNSGQRTSIAQSARPSKQELTFPVVVLLPSCTSVVSKVVSAYFLSLTIT